MAIASKKCNSISRRKFMNSAGIAGSLLLAMQLQAVEAMQPF